MVEQISNNQPACDCNDFAIRQCPWKEWLKQTWRPGAGCNKRKSIGDEIADTGPVKLEPIVPKSRLWTGTHTKDKQENQ